MVATSSFSATACMVEMVCKGGESVKVFFFVIGGMVGVGFWGASQKIDMLPCVVYAPIFSVVRALSLCNQISSLVLYLFFSV